MTSSHQPDTDPPSRGGSALSRCVKDVAAFLDSDFGRQPVHVPAADAGDYADLLGLDQFDHIVATMALRAPAFRLVKDGETVPASACTRSGRIGSRPVTDLIDVGRVHALFADGATIVLQGLQRYWPPVTAFARGLELALGHPVQANAYLTPPVASGLDLHADRHDVFALQTHGRKRWVVHPPWVAADIEGPADEAWDLELRPGDALYLPRGTRHAAQTVDRPSLHLTIGVHTTTWGDLVRRGADRAATELPELDAPLPPGWQHDPDRFAAQLVDHLEAAAHRLRGQDAAPLLADEARRFAAGRQPDLEGGLRDLLMLDQVDHDTVLVRRPGTSCHLAVDGDRLTVTLGDRRLAMPAIAAPAVERIAAHDRVTPRDLDGLLHPDSQLVLARRLVREGLLTIAR